MSQNTQFQPPPRIFDQLEAKYTEEAQKNQQIIHNYKNIYSKLISGHKQQAQQRKAQQEYLTKLERQKIKQFWDNQENRRRQEERKKKQQINEIRAVNRSMADYIGENPTQDNYLFSQQDYLQFLEQERRKDKEAKQIYLNQNNFYADLRRKRDKQDKQDDISFARGKQDEALEIQKKRQQQLLYRRQKFQPNAAAYRYLDEQYREKQQYEDMLQNYIVNEGALDIQNRIMRQKLLEEEKYKNKKQSYISELKDQLQSDQKRHKSVRRSVLESDKNIIDLQNSHLRQYQNWQRARKSEQHKKILDTLKSQIKPRVLRQQPDRIENAGIGSPVHIGKFVNDDRRKQLQYIEKSLKRELQTNS